MITEQMYPPIKWHSYRPNTGPENIVMAAFSKDEVAFMRDSKAFKNLMGLLGFDYYEGNSLELRLKEKIALPSFEPHRHIHLNNDALNKVEYDHNFRNKLFGMSRAIPSSSGTITFKNGCYIYRILNPEDSRIYVKANFTNFQVQQGSKYFAVALFFEDNFMAFEEGSISPTGDVIVGKEAFYQPISDVGQYISFTVISLAAFYFNFLKSKVLPPNSELNSTSQPINFLEV